MKDAAILTASLMVFIIFVLWLGRYLEWNRKATTVPACFGNMPSNPQHRAEFDCPNCEYRGSCFYANAPRDVAARQGPPEGVDMVSRDVGRPG